MLEFLNRHDESVEAAKCALSVYRERPGDNSNEIKKLEEFCKPRESHDANDDGDEDEIFNR